MSLVRLCDTAGAEDDGVRAVSAQFGVRPDVLRELRLSVAGSLAPRDVVAPMATASANSGSSAERVPVGTVSNVGGATGMLADW